MKASFCTNVFDFEEMEPAISQLAHLEYDGLELWDQYLQKADIPRLENRLSINNIKVSQLCPYFNFTGTKKERENSIDIAERYIKLANILDCNLIRVFTGSVGSKESTKEQWKMAVEGLKETCDLGKDDGIYFVLETHPNSLMDTSDSTLKLLGDIDKDNLKVNLQVPLMNNENVMASARKLGKYTVHLHAHNWYKKRDAENWQWKPEELTFLDSGDYDFESFLKILVEEGFNGYISIEHATHGGKHSAFETASYEITYLKKVIQKIQMRGKRWKD